MNFSKRNGRDSINQNSQFFSVTVQFTEWAVCSKRKSLSLENVSSACMLSFTFRIEAGRKYSSWQISDAHCSGFHFKKQHKPLLVQAKPNLNFNFKKTSCYAQKPNTALFCFFSSHRHNVWSTFTDTNCPGSTICPCHFCHLLCTMKLNWLNSQFQSESSKAREVTGLIPVVKEVLVMTTMSKIEDAIPSLVKINI